MSVGAAAGWATAAAAARLAVLAGVAIFATAAADVLAGRAAIEPAGLPCAH